MWRLCPSGPWGDSCPPMTTAAHMTDRLLTAGEVADQLRVSTMTVYRLIRRGDLAAVRVGRNYRVRAGDLEAYLSTHVVDPADVEDDRLARGEAEQR